MDFDLFPTAEQLLNPKAKRAPRKGGAKAQETGKKAEEVIDRTCEIYEHEGRGFFTATSARFRPEKMLPKGRAVGWLSKGPVDRVGVATFYSGPMDVAEESVGIAFDVKSIQVKTSFPLASIDAAQVKFIEKWSDHGLAFILVRFAALDRWFVLRSGPLLAFWQNRDERASIPLKWFIDNNTECPKRGNFVDFLAALER